MPTQSLEDALAVAGGAIALARGSQLGPYVQLEILVPDRA
jgi:hypothetical protein